MRIDAMNSVSQLYRANSTKKTYKTGMRQAADSLEISQAGKDFQIAKMAVKAAPDVRMDLVNDIKNKMAAGEYNISMGDVADKLLSK